MLIAALFLGGFFSGMIFTMVLLYWAAGDESERTSIGREYN